MASRIAIVGERLIRAWESGRRVITLDYAFAPLTKQGNAPDSVRKKRKFCQSVRKYIEGEYENLCICTVGSGFFAPHKDDKGRVVRKPYSKVRPKLMEEAEDCLAGPLPIAAFYFPIGGKSKAEETDKIYMAYLERNGTQAEKERIKNIIRTYSGVRGKVLSSGDAVKIIEDSRTDAYENMETDTMEELLRLHQSFGQNIAKAAKEWAETLEKVTKAKKKKLVGD